MKKLLITGFEPFGGEKINPSWEAVSRLSLEINGYLLTKLLIPVVFGEGAQKVIEKADEISPDVIICVGQAGGRQAITPELVAINLRHASISDNCGYQPKDEPIIAGGDTAYPRRFHILREHTFVTIRCIPCFRIIRIPKQRSDLSTYLTQKSRLKSRLWI